MLVRPGADILWEPAHSSKNPSAPGWPYPLGIIQIAGQMPFWHHASQFARPAARLIGERSLTFFFATETLPAAGSGFVFHGDEIAGCMMPAHDLESFTRLRKLALKTFRAAGYPSFARRRPALWHTVGTARMGNDPASSVTDASGKVHGIEGLYVADQSVLPSAGAVNTTLTTIAVALRTGDHIAASLFGGTAVSELGPAGAFAPAWMRGKDHAEPMPSVQ